MTLLQNTGDVQIDKDSGLPYDAHVGAWTYFQVMRDLRNLRHAVNEYLQDNRPHNVLEVQRLLQESEKHLDHYQIILNTQLVFLRNKVAVAPLVGMTLRATQELTIHGHGLMARANDVFVVTKVYSVEEARQSGGQIAELRGVRYEENLDEWDNCIYIGADGADCGPELTISHFTLVDIEDEEVFDEITQDPCPFCASTDVFIQDLGDGGNHGTCRACHCDGPFKESKMEALIAWNVRKRGAAA